MIIDAGRYFEHVAREYVEVLRRTAAENYRETAERLGQVLGELWCRAYLLHCPFEAVIDVLVHPPYEFLFDSVATKTGDPRLEDRVVVAYGRSQARPDLAKLFDEMESALGAGESPATAAEVLRFVVEHNCHALSRHRKENLDKAVAAALGEGPEPDGATSDLLRRLAAKPTPLLNGAEVRKLRLALLPLLAADPWPRVARSSRQYSALRETLGMDVGHFISHASCGTFDINTFPQNADLNRGRSPSGRKYRMMERYVAGKPGTFFFSRPVYGALSWVPEYLELGALVQYEERHDLPVVDGEGGRHAVGDVVFYPAGRQYGWWLGVFENPRPFHSDLCSEEDFGRAIETAEELPRALRGLLGTKLSLRRTRRSRGIAAHHAGLKEVEERLAELGEIVEAARDLLDKRRA